jgi:hypothetical protein
MKKIWKWLFEVPDHVRLSDNAKILLDDPSLSIKLRDCILENKKRLANGETINIPGTGIYISDAKLNNLCQESE